MTALEAALAYAARGWPVLPIRPRVKTPYTTHGVKDATTDPGLIEAWFEQWPDAGVAIATGAPGPQVLDIDDLDRAPRELLALVVPTAASGRGRHLYFTGTDRRTTALGYGELRGRGGYVLAPPTTHPSGKQYTWLVVPDDAPLIAVPEVVPADRQSAGAGEAKAVERVAPGGMHEYLTDLAVRLARAGMGDVDAVERALIAEFETKRVPDAQYAGGRKDTHRLAAWAVESEIAGREAPQRTAATKKKSPAKAKKPPADYRPAEEKAAASHPPVDGAELLESVRAFLERYVILPSDEVADLLALWTLHSWTVKAAFATPYLRIVSAAAESGKTLLMEILAVLTRNGWHAVNPSTAVLYRKIDRQAPTLLLDEMDNYPIDERRDALSVLNSGYKRGATVDRCKDNGDLETFNAFCPKAYAGLDRRSLVATLLSRSITVRLERKKPGEKVDMWIAPLTEPFAAPLRQLCAAWADQHVEALSAAHPELPEGITNRAAEIWWALLAIADEVGGDWPARTRTASRALLAGGDAYDDQSDQMQLLSDIRDAFGRVDTIYTRDLLEALNALDEAPWAARRKGKGLNARGLSMMLRPFKIRPRTVRLGDDTAKGYHLSQFEDAFARHLPEPSQASQPSQLSPDGKPDVTDVPDVTAQEGSVSEGTQATLDIDDYAERYQRRQAEGAWGTDHSAPQPVPRNMPEEGTT